MAKAGNACSRISLPAKIVSKLSRNWIFWGKNIEIHSFACFGSNSWLRHWLSLYHADGGCSKLFIKSKTIHAVYIQTIHAVYIQTKHANISIALKSVRNCILQISQRLISSTRSLILITSLRFLPSMSTHVLLMWIHNSSDHFPTYTITRMTSRWCSENGFLILYFNI